MAGCSLAVCLAVLAATAARPVAGSAAGGICPDGLTLMARFNYSLRGSAAQKTPLAACEDLRGPNGSLIFMSLPGAEDAQRQGASSSSPWPLVLKKRVASNQPLDGDDDRYLNFTKTDVLGSPVDLLGNALLGIHGHPSRPTEPTLEEVTAAVPPIRLINSARVWTANRESGKDATFDEKAGNPTGGTPNPDHVNNILPGKTSSTYNAEGLLGGDLPIILLNFPVSPGYVFWEMSVVPVAEGTGHEQPIFVRFLQVNASAAAGRSPPGTMYFNSYEYAPSLGCWNEDFSHPSGCDAPSHYFAAVLDAHFFWERTWSGEGRMNVTLPTRPETDGTLLATQASHALVLDMITRSDGIWPRYGTNPGYDQEGIGADGFPEIFTASMMASLEWGMFTYARQVLDNFLTYFIKKDGFLLYRGLEMAQHGRFLTNIAQYYKYTGDGELLLKHLDKIVGIADLLRRRYAAAVAAYPPSDSRHGMPRGNDEADLFWGTTVGYHTELPFISIAAEMWRGLRDCGEALQEIGERVGKEGRGRAASEAARCMLAEAADVIGALQQSMAKDAFPDGDGGVICHPYAAGIRECGELERKLYSPRDSEGWRTYAEAMYSGALSDRTIQEILEWHQTRQGSRVKGSRLKLGALSGCGGDVSCGDQLMTFTVHGWGYGLLQADLVEPFLLQYYALSAHAYTRGTWIAPESVSLDRNSRAPAYCTPAELTAPILLRWLLVWEHPVERSLWLGRALPRVWLSDGEHLSVEGAATSWGRVSFSLTSALERERAVRASVTVPAAWGAAGARRAAPAGGLRLRLRVPGGLRMRFVSVGGSAWGSFNASSESVDFSSSDLAQPGMFSKLQQIIVRYDGGELYV